MPKTSSDYAGMTPGPMGPTSAMEQHQADKRSYLEQKRCQLDPDDKLQSSTGDVTYLPQSKWKTLLRNKKGVFHWMGYSNQRPRKTPCANPKTPKDCYISVDAISYPHPRLVGKLFSGYPKIYHLMYHNDSCYVLVCKNNRYSWKHTISMDKVIRSYKGYQYIMC